MGILYQGNGSEGWLATPTQPTQLVVLPVETQDLGKLYRWAYGHTHQSAAYTGNSRTKADLLGSKGSGMQVRGTISIQCQRTCQVEMIMVLKRVSHQKKINTDYLHEDRIGGAAVLD